MNYAHEGWRENMILETHGKEREYKALVLSSTLLTSEDAGEEIREIKLKVPREMGLVPGFNVGICIPGPHPFGNEVHERLYTVMDLSLMDKDYHVSLCVRRCSYIDDISGESYKGIASNYLCNCGTGDTLNLRGPYGTPFVLPDDPKANLVLIAQGTGIAPFRALFEQVRELRHAWEGEVHLYYGAQSGLEMVYSNSVNNMLSELFDSEGFKAFHAVSPRPHLNDPVALDTLLQDRAETLWPMIRQPDTYVYVSGVKIMASALERAFTSMSGSPEKWQRTHAELVAGGRWQELLY